MHVRCGFEWQKTPWRALRCPGRGVAVGRAPRRWPLTPGWERGFIQENPLSKRARCFSRCPCRVSRQGHSSGLQTPQWSCARSVRVRCGRSCPRLCSPEAVLLLFILSTPRSKWSESEFQQRLLTPQPQPKSGDSTLIIRACWCELKKKGFVSNVWDERGEAGNFSSAPGWEPRHPHNQVLVFFETFTVTVWIFSTLFILIPLKTLDPVAGSCVTASTSWAGSVKSTVSRQWHRNVVLVARSLIWLYIK